MKGLLKKLLATATLATACTVLFVGCETSPAEVALNNFQNEEITVVLDDAFTLPSDKVSDENGNEYTVTYKATTKSGKTVGTADGVLWIKEFETHYVECQAQVGNTVKTRVLTLTVKDESAPEITFGDVYDGYVGEGYLLPTLTVNDSSGETITPSIKAYMLNGNEKGTETACEKGVFTPSTAGYYLLEATATDSSGNSATATKTVYIRPQVEKTTILSFDSPVDIDKVTYPFNNTRKLINQNWLPEFAGQKNVLQVCFEGDAWAPKFIFTPMQDLASASSTLLDEYDYAILRIYMVKSDEYPNAWDGIKLNGDARSATLGFNQWVDYKFPLSAFADALKADGTMEIYESNSLNLYKPGSTTEKTWRKGMFYIGGIFLANEVTVSTAEVQNSSEVEITAKDAQGADIDLAKVTAVVVAPEGTVIKIVNGKFTPTTQGTYTVYVYGDGFWGKATVTTE